MLNIRQARQQSENESSLSSLDDGHPIMLRSYIDGSIKLLAQLNNSRELFVSSTESEDCLLRVKNVHHFTFISCSNSLSLKSVILLCCVAVDSTTISELQFYRYSYRGGSTTTVKHRHSSHHIDAEPYWTHLTLNAFTMAQDLAKCTIEQDQPNGQQSDTHRLNLDLSQCLVSGTEDHFCMYVKGTQALYIWAVEQINNSDGINVSSIMQFDVFASVFSLVISWTHIIVGKVNCIHIYNWRSMYKKQQLRGSSSNTSATIASSNVTPKQRSTTSTTSPELNERMGRAIYLPKITKTTTKEAKSSDVAKKLNLSKGVDQTQENTSNPTTTTTAEASAVRQGKSGKKKKLKKTSEEPSKQQSVDAPAQDEIIKTTISQQANEKVVDLQLISNSKIILRSNLGNLFALNCLMPFEKDNLVQLYSNLQNGAIQSSPSSSIVSTSSGNVIATADPVTLFHVVPDQSELTEQIDQGLAAIVLRSNTILLTRIKTVFDAIDQQQPQHDNVEIPVHTAIHHPEDIKHICFLSPDYLFVCSGDDYRFSMYNI